MRTCVLTISDGLPVERGRGGRERVAGQDRRGRTFLGFEQQTVGLGQCVSLGWSATKTLANKPMRRDDHTEEVGAVRDWVPLLTEKFGIEQNQMRRT